MNKDIFNRCDVCGRFFSFNDIEKGMATLKMLTPDSDYSYEEWESLCPNHTKLKCYPTKYSPTKL